MADVVVVVAGALDVAGAAAVWVLVTVADDVDPVTVSVRVAVEADAPLVTVVVDGEVPVVLAEPAPSAAVLARSGVVAEGVANVDPDRATPA